MPDIRIEFVSSAVLRDMESAKRIEYLLRVIKRGCLIVLEERLGPDEERLLIEETMNLVNDKFTGIEISSLGASSTSQWKERIIRMLGGKTSGLTVIGPAKMIKEIKNDRSKINLLAGFAGDKP
ncbi:MAG: DUF2073 domain-containing protein [Candidatus Micrarchaeota archaeon]|nr:DUF2073 domain-containing protein [Candidatus Micrarchaeota archaeon]